MNKRAIALLLVIVLLFSQPLIVQASTRATLINPRVNFDSNNVKCTVVISANTGESIIAQVSLYEDGALIRTWYRTGTTFLIFEDSVPATTGCKYTLIVNATIAGIKQPTASSSLT